MGYDQESGKSKLQIHSATPLHISMGLKGIMMNDIHQSPKAEPVVFLKQ